MIEHRGLCNLVGAQIEGFAVEPDSRVLQFASFSFDACISEILMTLCRGAALYLPKQQEVLVGENLTDAVARHSITHVTLPPAVLAGMPENARMDSIQVMVVAGDAVTGSLFEALGSGAQIHKRLRADRNHGMRDDAHLRCRGARQPAYRTADCEYEGLYT